MIEMNERLNGRWMAVRPAARLNARNFTIWEVEDEQMNQRPALLKTVRSSDVPGDDLYDWRRRALAREVERFRDVTSPALPEPLDAFTLPTGNQAVVYAPLGGGAKNYLLREVVQRWGFVDGRGCRQVDRIARVMHDLARVTEELWQAQYVHPNLNPEHVYLFQDGVIRVTGTSAVCRVQNGRVRADEPGLRNLTIGFQSAAQHRAAAGGAAEPLDAARVRWYSYAALALDLLWGRDLQDYCREIGRPGVELTPAVEQDIRADFPALFTRNYQAGGANGLRPALDEVFRLLRLCLSPDGPPLPADLYDRFTEVWNLLDLPGYADALPTADAEGHWRRDRGWKNEFFLAPKPAPGVRRRRTPAPAADGEVGQFLVCGYEEPVRRRIKDKDVEVGRYEVVNLAHPGRRRAEIEPMMYDSYSVNANLFLPGDVVPGVVRKGDTLTWVQPTDWARNRNVELENGQPLRALSLGRRASVLGGVVRRGPDGEPLARREDPWALVEVEGGIRALRLRPAENRRYTVYPRPGRFFPAAYWRDQLRGRGVVMLHPPDVGQLVGVKDHALVTDADDERLLFDMPLGEDYLVSCILPRSYCPPEARDKVRKGDRIPVRVAGARDDLVYSEWDHDLAGSRAGVGAVYDGAFDKRTDDDRFAYVKFGDGGRFEGELALRDGSIPWGLPFYAWQPGAPVRVRVVAPPQGGRRFYRLRYAGDDARPVAEVAAAFPAGAELDGVVLGHSDRGVHVRLDAGTGRGLLQVEGLIRYHLLRRAVHVNPYQELPPGTVVPVAVGQVDPAERLVWVRPRS